MARGEVPEIALLQVVDEAAALGVESCDADLAFKDVGPLCFFVPVELADDTCFQAHVHTGKLLARAKLTDSGLTRPATFLDANVRVGKRPAHVGNGAMISAWRADKVRILSFTSSVPWAHHSCTITIALMQC